MSAWVPRMQKKASLFSKISFKPQFCLEKQTLYKISNSASTYWAESHVKSLALSGFSA